MKPTKHFIKLKLSLLLILFMLNFNSINSQQNNGITRINLGVKKTVPNDNIDALIKKGDYNFIDAFEYELVKLLVEYIEHQENYELVQIPIKQNKKHEAVKHGTKIDALLFAFSKTIERIQDDGIHFSKPYYQNKALGIITKRDNISVRSFGDDLIRIGSVEMTRASEELKKIYIRLRNISSARADKFIITEYENHEKLIEALKLKKIDVAAGDTSRLFYETIEGKFLYGGDLPTKNSVIQDSYCIGITPLKPSLKRVFDNFIIENKSAIEELEKRWMQTITENAYANYRNRTQNKYKTYILYIVIFALVLIALTYFFLKKSINRAHTEILKKEKQLEMAKGQRKTQEELIVTNEYRNKLDILTESIRLKTEDKLTDEDVSNAGIQLFDTAQKSITYVGSGGFMSDEYLSVKWSNSLNKCLKNRNIIFKRVVDLPKTDANKLCFKENQYFNPNNNDYVARYVKWLLLQYHSLRSYTNLEIINSRGAALWSYGIVMIIKDQSEILIFTTDKSKKIGMMIPSSELSKGLHSLIKDVESIGKPLFENVLKETFFKNKEGGYKDDDLIPIFKEIDSLDSENPLTESILTKIDKLYKKLRAAKN